MDQINKGELNRLMAAPEGLCVSIYIPTYRKGPEVDQNPIRFKNAVKQAETTAKKASANNPSEISRILDPARKLLAEKDFWMNQDRSLAVFLAENIYSYYRLGVDIRDPLIVVNDRFHLKPLLAQFTSDAYFYLLAVTLKGAQLYECTRYDIKKLPVKDMPAGLADALKYDVDHEQVQWHTGSGARPDGGKKRAAIYHGQNAAEVKNEQILQYFQAIDKSIRPYLKENRLVLFTGFDHHFPLYKQANTYPHLIADTAVTKNPADLKEDQLHDAAWEAIAPHFRRDYEAAVENYHNYKGTGRVGTDLKQIIHSAMTGRVEYLIVGVGIHQWGKYDTSSDEIILHEEKRPLDQDLIDLAAFAVIINSGNVYAVAPDMVPDGCRAVAFYRY